MSVRYLEIRRHSFTKKGGRGRGSDLSPEGVAAARAVGPELGEVAYVATSEAPRTVETAIAMGFAVDDLLPTGSGYVGTVRHHDQWSWHSPYVRYRELFKSDPVLAAAAARELELWHSVLGRVPDGAKALVVSHGGMIEPTLVAAVPAGDHEKWGEPFSHLDGVRLDFDDERCVRVEFRRYRPAGRSADTGS